MFLYESCRCELVQAIGERAATDASTKRALDRIECLHVISNGANNKENPAFAEELHGICHGAADIVDGDFFWHS